MFQSLIIVLYVMDNETNFVVRCSVVVGLGIEVWKIFKVVNVKVSVLHVFIYPMHNIHPLLLIQLKGWNSHIHAPI